MRRALKQLLYGSLFLALFLLPIAVWISVRTAALPPASLPTPSASSPVSLGSVTLISPTPLRPVALLPVSNTSPTTAYRVVIGLTLFDVFGIRLAGAETRVVLNPLEERPVAFFTLALDARDVARSLSSITSIEALPPLPRVTASLGTLTARSEATLVLSGSVENTSSSSLSNVSTLVLLTNEKGETLSASRAAIGSLAPAETRSFTSFFDRSLLPPATELIPEVFVDL